MMNILEFLPMAALLAVIIGLPLLADEMPGTTQESATRSGHKAAIQPQRGVTVPYISMRTPHRGQ